MECRPEQNEVMQKSLLGAKWDVCRLTTNAFAIVNFQHLSDLHAEVFIISPSQIEAPAALRTNRGNLEVFHEFLFY